jgi:hypothetical protein
MPSIHVELSDFDIEDLIEEVERSGYVVMEKEDAADYEKKIHALMHDFINWYQFGMKNENFEKILKEFFKDTIDEHVI